MIGFQYVGEISGLREVGGVVPGTSQCIEMVKDWDSKAEVLESDVIVDFVVEI